MTREHKRRTFVKLAGSAGVVGLTGLAGCSGDGGDGGGDGGDGGSDGGDGGSDGGDGGSDGGDGGDGDSDGSDDGGSTDGGGMQVIKLGGSMSLSGDNADLGQLYKDSYEQTIQRINEAGGVEAGDGNTYELEMVLRDDETDASKSRAIYQELIDQEGIEYLLGPYSSTVTLPASAVAANNKVPMVEGGGASPEIFSQGNEWIFGLLPTADKYPLSFIDMVSSLASGSMRVALLSEDDTFSTSSAEGARNKVSNTDGMELVVDREFPTETSDLSTNLGRVRDNDADILLLTAHQKHAVIAADQMESQEVDVDAAMATVGSLTDSFKEQTGANGNYWYGPSSWAVNANFSDPVFGSTSEYVEDHESMFDYTPDYHNAAGVGVVETFVRAFENTDELSPRAVRDTIRELEFSTAYGTVAFADNGVINKNMIVYQWQPDPGKQIVYPEAARQSEPIYPTPAWSER